MITRENFREVVLALPDKDKRRILNSDKEFVVLYLSIFNSGRTVKASVTNDFMRYMNVSYRGNAIVPIEEVVEILNEERSTK